MASVLCDLESDRIRDKEEKKKKATEVEDNRRQKSEKKQIRENEDKLRGLESCEALVPSVLTFGVYHINTLCIRLSQSLRNKSVTASTSSTFFGVPFNLSNPK